MDYVAPLNPLLLLIQSTTTTIQATSQTLLPIWLPNPAETVRSSILFVFPSMQQLVVLYREEGAGVD